MLILTQLYPFLTSVAYIVLLYPSIHPCGNATKGLVAGQRDDEEGALSSTPISNFSLSRCPATPAKCCCLPHGWMDGWIREDSVRDRSQKKGTAVAKPALSAQHRTVKRNTLYFLKKTENSRAMTSDL